MGRVTLTTPIMGWSVIPGLLALDNFIFCLHTKFGDLFQPFRRYGCRCKNWKWVV